jgi:pimeloyl-ACP methyl ester carboxylesterase
MRHLHRILIIAAAFILSMARVLPAQDIAGDWQGTLKAGGVELRLVLHVLKGEDAQLKATLDSVDQGANGIPVTSISLTESKLTFTVEAVRGSYDGKVNPDVTFIDGTWSQGQSLPLAFRRAAEPPGVTSSDIDGAWLGTLDVGVAKLRLVFHFTNTPNGLTATLDSLDQGAKGLPVTTVTRNGAFLRLELKQLGGTFEGTIDAASASIEGTWTQLGASRPLVLKRSNDTAELELRRPQNPVKPYPYREEDVAYDNKAALVRLSATLTVPAGQGPFPAVVLLTGSGPQDRDESLLGHRPFLVLADHLTRHGIVVLRADDRGVGKSGGNFDTATTADFATDAEAGVAYLQTRPEVNPKKIGLVGHSEGGIIAPMVAARNPGVAFIVLMAGSGVPGDEVLVAQNVLIAQAGGISREQAEQNANQLRETVALVKQEKDNAVLETKLRERLAGRIPPAQIDRQIKTLGGPWFRYFLAYDPATALKQVKCPVLAINGEKDLQVPPKQNLPAIRSALEAAGNKNVEVDELPGLNHLFQTAKTGAPSEYAQIEETMSPVALDRIARWILKQ